MATTSEQLLAEIADGEGLYLIQAARLIPSHRSGKPTTMSCVLRWVLDGVLVPGGGRVKLEAARLAGKWVTSKAAIRRFVHAQTHHLDTEPAPTPRAPAARRRASERDRKALEELGI
jgi:hypothetical protein